VGRLRDEGKAERECVREIHDFGFGDGYSTVTEKKWRIVNHSIFDDL